MSDTPKTCRTCRWVDPFPPRPDEVAQGHTLGCRKPGWEGYTSAERMACGGVFYRRQTAAVPPLPAAARRQAAVAKLLAQATDPVPTAYYLEDATGYTDGLDYCLPCAQAALASIAHGEYGLGGYRLHGLSTDEADSPRFCVTCGTSLEYFLTDDGAAEELAFLLAHPPTVLDPATAYALLRLVEALDDPLPPALLTLLDTLCATQGATP